MPSIDAGSLAENDPGMPLFNMAGNSENDSGPDAADAGPEYMPNTMNSLPYGFQEHGPGGHGAAEGHVGEMQPVSSKPFDDVMIEPGPWGGDVDTSDGSPWSNT